MSRIIILLFSLLTIGTSLAQDRVKQIRDLYSTAMHGVKEQREGVEPQFNLKLNLTRMEAAVGAVRYEHELYLQTNEQQCAFYRCKRQFGPYDPSFTEALFDAAGNAIFIYTRETFAYDQTTWRYEERFYFNEDGSLNKLLRKGIWADGKERPLTAEDFTNDAETLKKNCEQFLSTYINELSVSEEFYEDEP